MKINKLKWLIAISITKLLIIIIMHIIKVLLMV